MTQPLEEIVPPSMHKARAKIWGVLTSAIITTLAKPYIIKETFDLFQRLNILATDSERQYSSFRESLSAMMQPPELITVTTALCATATVATLAYFGGKAIYRWANPPTIHQPRIIV